MSESTPPVNGGESPRQNAEPAPQGMDLRDVLTLFLANKWWVAGIIGVVTALFIAYALLATPIYRTDALIQIQQSASPFSQLSGANDILASLFGGATQASAEIRIMTSRAVLDPIIRRLHLDVIVRNASPGTVGVRRFMVAPAQEGKRFRLVSRGNGRFVLRNAAGRLVLSGRVGHPARSRDGRVSLELEHFDLAAGRHVVLVRAPVQAVFADLSQRLSALQLGHDTGIVQLTLEGPRPRHIAHVLDVIESQYLAQNVAAISAQARKSLAYINRQLPSLKVRMNLAESRLTAYQAKSGTVDLSAQTKALLQQSMALEGELSQLELAQAALAERYTSRYPALSSLRRQEQTVHAKITALEADVRALPAKAQGYVRLLRDAKVYTKLYTLLLAKAQDLQIAAAGAVGNARVIDHALVPIKRFKPNRKRIVILGFLLGLLLAAGFVFLRRALHPRVLDPGELEARTGLPVHAVIPASAQERRLSRRRRGGLEPQPHTLLSALAPQAAATEALRSLRTHFGFELGTAGGKLLAITGPNPSVGKSFLAANLAYLIACSGKRVLLIDGDLRRGHLNQYFGSRYAPGLAEWLQGEAELTACLQAGRIEPTLDFLPTGRYPEHPAEFLLRHDLAGRLHSLAAEYDLALVDLPPTAVTDPVPIMRAADINLLVLRGGAVNIGALAFTIRRLGASGVRLNGFVLNVYEPRFQVVGPGGYGAYGYGYGGYAIKAPRRRWWRVLVRKRPSGEG
jgi:tyrosine-protein kinase Etk/Wzc